MPECCLLDHGSERHRLTILAHRLRVIRTLVACLCQAKDRAEQREREADDNGNASHPVILSAGRRNDTPLLKLNPKSHVSRSCIVDHITGDEEATEHRRRHKLNDLRADAGGPNRRGERDDGSPSGQQLRTEPMYCPYQTGPTHLGDRTYPLKPPALAGRLVEGSY